MGHKAWNPNGTGASMMRIATVSIGGTLAAVGGGSIIGSMAVPAIGSSGISISASMTTVSRFSVSGAKFVWNYNKIGTVGAGMNLVYQGSTKGLGGIDWSQPASLIAFKNPLMVGFVDGAVDVSFNGGIKLGPQKGLKNWVTDTGVGIIYGLPTGHITTLDKYLLMYNAASIGAGHIISKASEKF